MTTTPSLIDISHMPDLMRLAEEVEITKKPPTTQTTQKDSCNSYASGTNSIKKAKGNVRRA